MISNDKLENFEIGQAKSSGDMTWDEMVAVFGMPIAYQVYINGEKLAFYRNAIFVVKEVNLEKKEVTVREL